MATEASGTQDAAGEARVRCSFALGGSRAAPTGDEASRDRPGDPRHALSSLPASTRDASARRLLRVASSLARYTLQARKFADQILVAAIPQAARGRMVEREHPAVSMPDA